jgi:hypothetical protein
MHEQNEALISAAEQCARACEHCATACLGEKEVSKMVDCIKLDRDCADLCRAIAALAERDSSFTGEFAKTVASICKACGDECSRHSMMEHCRQCAEACRNCEQACSGLAA